MIDEPPFRTAPLPTVRRMPAYLNLLRRLRAEGCQVVSGTRIAEELGLDSVQVRKDFSYTGMVGKAGVGFQIPTVIHMIETFLGWDNTTDAFLIGAGSLGTAIMGYQGFQRYGLNIVAAFDKNPEKNGLNIHGKQVLPMDKLLDLAQRMHVQVGIITVPAEGAQEVADQLVEAGVGAIWNFAPVSIKVPPTIILQNTELASELAVLSVMLSQAQQKPTPPGLNSPSPSSHPPCSSGDSESGPP
jgi:redox-sensing transcriptional repressor